MLRRIGIEKLELGMFIASIEAPWWAHPFWKRSFLLERPADLDKLRNSAVEALVIDEAKGIALSAPPAPSAPAIPTTRKTAAARISAGTSALKRAARTCSRDELERAAQIVQQSKRAVTEMFSEARMGAAIDPERVMPLVDEIAASVGRDTSALLEVTRLKRKNEYTYLHSVAVCALMINLGRQLRQPEYRIRPLGMAGLLHDIGKMAVPDAILDKPGALTEEEVAIIRAHPAEGHAMLLLTPDISPIVLDVCLHHHERVDGTGYPHHLQGDDLSLHARMGAICDVYDAVTSNRPYKSAWSPSQALARMVSWEGHFDPEILNAFIRSIGIYPPGTLVRLRTNRLGLVIDANDRNPSEPHVRSFYSTVDRAFMPLQEVQVGTTLKDDTIVGVESGPRWFGGSWLAVQQLIAAGEEPKLSLAEAVGRKLSSAA